MSTDSHSEILRCAQDDNLRLQGQFPYEILRCAQDDNVTKTHYEDVSHGEDMNCHGGCVKANVTTPVLCQAYLAVLYLSFPSFSLKLPDNLYDLAYSCFSNWMSPGEQSAGCIDRKFSSQPSHAVLDQFRS